MNKIYLTVLLAFLFSCKNTSVQSGNQTDGVINNAQIEIEPTLIKDLKADKFTVKKLVKQASDTLFIAYKVQNQGEYFTQNFTSSLYIRVVDLANNYRLDSIIETGNNYSEIILEDEVIISVDNQPWFFYKICADGDDGCESKRLKL